MLRTASVYTPDFLATTIICFMASLDATGFSTKFHTVLDRNGKTMVFGFGPDGQLHVAQEDVQQIRRQISLNAKLGLDSTAKITALVSSQDPDTTIFIAFSYFLNTGAYVSALKPFKPAELDFTNPNINLKENIITTTITDAKATAIKLGTLVTGSPFPPVFVAYKKQSGMQYSNFKHFVATADFSSLQDQADLRMPADTPAIIDFAPGSISRRDGVYALYETAVPDQPNLCFTAYSVTFDSILKCPPGAISLSVLKNPTGLSEPLVGADGLWHWKASDILFAGAAGYLISDDRQYQNIANLRVVQRGSDVQIWTSNTNRGVSQLRTTWTPRTAPNDAPVPEPTVLVPNTQGGDFSAIQTDAGLSSVLAINNKNQFVYFLQDTSSPLWLNLPFPIYLPGDNPPPPVNTPDDVCPVDRPTGDFSVDQNGQARYVFPIEVPKGTNEVQPQLSLQYSNSTGNGRLGVGWSLGGLSSVQRAKPNLALDQFTGPILYDSKFVRYSLDGRELLNISGAYGDPGTAYKTEVENYAAIRAADIAEGGFIVTDTSGAVTEYGTTPDSRVLNIEQNNVREWNLAKVTDVYGNTITYSYTTAPRLVGKSGEPRLPSQGISFIDRIKYTSNEREGLSSSRFVDFFYTSRPDPIVFTGAGDQMTIGHLLASVVTSILLPGKGDPTFVKQYELKYGLSVSTRCSILDSITERAGEDGAGLVPTTIGYTDQDSEAPWFDQDPKVTDLTATRDTANWFMMPLDVSGTGSSDLVCIRRDSSGSMAVTTYLAQWASTSSSRPRMNWSLAGPNQVRVPLPTVFGNSDGTAQPSIIPTDLGGDGKTDLLIPYRGSNGNMWISVSKSSGDGYDAYTLADSGAPWYDNGQFFAMDCDGNGRADVVEVYKNGNNIAFRTFFSTYGTSDEKFLPAKISNTNDSADGTIKWLSMDVNRDGVQDFVRIWETKDGSISNLKATSYISKNSGMFDSVFEKGSTVDLGTFDEATRKETTIIPCDANSDGIQDVVICQMHTDSSGPETKMTFSFTVFLCDGNGGFKKQPSRPSETITVQPDEAPSDGEFHVLDLDGAGIPSIVYLYTRKESNDWAAVVSQCSFDASFSGLTLLNIGSSTESALPRTVLSPTDLTGSGKAGWIAWSIIDNMFTYNAIYNIKARPDLLSTTTDPLGLMTTMSYLPLSVPAVYQPSAELTYPLVDAQRRADACLPMEGPYRSIMGTTMYVIEQYSIQNNVSRNQFSIKQQFELNYAGGRVDLHGRGWQGFATVTVVDKTNQFTSIDTYLQDFPLTAFKSSNQILSETLHPYSLYSQLEQSRGNQTASAVLRQASDYMYTVSQSTINQRTYYTVQKTTDYADIYESGTWIKRNGSDYLYDSYGNMTLQTYFSSNLLSGPKTTQSWTRCTWKVIGNCKTLMTARKLSEIESNRDMTKFELGDLSFEAYVYDPSTISLKESLSWSTSLNKNISVLFHYDGFGNKTLTTLPNGSREMITYDDFYKTFPVKTEQIAEGLNSTCQLAWDPRFSLGIAAADEYGVITFNEMDLFGRPTKTFKTGISDGTNPISVTDIPISTLVVAASNEFLNILSQVKITLDSSMALGNKERSGRLSTPNRSTTLVSRTAGDLPSSTVIEYLDCQGKTREKKTTFSKDQDVWVFYVRDSAGQVVQESFPKFFSAGATENEVRAAQPPVSECVRASFDSLGRPYQRLTPSALRGLLQTLSEVSYTMGGQCMSTVTGSLSLPNANGQQTLTPLTKMVVTMDTIHGESRPIETAKDDQPKTTFSYDAAGRLVHSVDPGGKKETIGYDSLGNVVLADNSYQNPNAVPNIPAQTRVYNENGLCVKDTNAAGETTQFDYDGLGRLSLRTESDNRQIKFTYNTSSAGFGIGKLRQVVTKASGTGATESQYDYEYDGRSRVVVSTLSLPSDGEFKTQFVYDLQDNLVSKTFPDSAKLDMSYGGDILLEAKLASNGSEPWAVTTNYPLAKYTPALLPTAWDLTGQGILSSTLSTELAYDNESRPVTQMLTNSSGKWIQQDLTYNPLGQITSSILNGTAWAYPGREETNYTYASGRVKGSTGTLGTRSYAYDASGSLTDKDGMTFAYNGADVTATKDNKSFSLHYDAAGRVQQRVVDSQTYHFTYDGRGKMSNVKDSSGDTVFEYTSNFDGKNILQVDKDGTRTVQVSADFQVLKKPDGSRVVNRSLYGLDRLLATVTGSIASGSSGWNSTGNQVKCFFQDTKSNITHILGGSGEVETKITYDEFGLPTPSGALQDNDRTFESREWNVKLGLLNFGQRWYDPVFGRFTTADDVWGGNPTIQQDVLNRYAFELNDPINNIDPSGHMSLMAGLFLGLSIAFLVAAVVVSVLTAGAATPLAVLGWGALTGALAGAGMAGVSYSIAHSEDDGWRFVGGYFANVAVGAAVGAITGAAFGLYGAYARIAIGLLKYAPVAQRILVGITWVARGLVSSGASVIDSLAFNGFERAIWDKEISLANSLALSAVLGFAFGFAGSAGEFGTRKLTGKLLKTYFQGARALAKETKDILKESFAFGVGMLFDGGNMGAITGTPNTHFALIGVGKKYREEWEDDDGDDTN